MAVIRNFKMAALSKTEIVLIPGIFYFSDVTIQVILKLNVI